MSEKWNIFGSDMFKIEVTCIKLSKMLYNLTKILEMLDKIWVCVLHRKVSVSSTVNSVEKKCNVFFIEAMKIIPFLVNQLSILFFVMNIHKYLS